MFYNETMLPDSKKSFTVLELLVVIAIIGLLTGIIIIGLQDALAKGRNAKRMAEVDTISKALELYYSDKNKYPMQDNDDSNDDWVCIEESSSFASEIKPYLPTIPRDPLYPQKSCYEQQGRYFPSQCPMRLYCYSYKSFNNGEKYAIRAKLEKGGYFSARSPGVGEVKNREEACNTYGICYGTYKNLPKSFSGLYCSGSCQDEKLYICPWAYERTFCRRLGSTKCSSICGGLDYQLSVTCQLKR